MYLLNTVPKASAILVTFEECHLLECYATWLLRSNVSEECIASIIRVTAVGKLGTMLAVTSN
jgi:hypothetical protein